MTNSRRARAPDALARTRIACRQELGGITPGKEGGKDSDKNTQITELRITPRLAVKRGPYAPAVVSPSNELKKGLADRVRLDASQHRVPFAVFFLYQVSQTYAASENRNAEHELDIANDRACD